MKALHQLSLSVKNSFVFDLRTLDAGIWLISDGVSSGKNILASAKISFCRGSCPISPDGHIGRFIVRELKKGGAAAQQNCRA
jgi:hypothetical protein